MPSAKRAQQRAAKQARQAEIERQQRRRRSIRTTIAVVVLAAAGTGIYFATTSSSSKTKVAAAKSSASTKAKPASTKAKPTSSSSSSATTTAALQAAANKQAVAAGCPADPHTALKKTLYKAPPPMTINTSTTYTATVETNAGGSFTMSLDPTEAPIAVNSFVFLADHGFYNCVIFHRVIPGFVDQTGDPTGTGTGGPGYEFTEHGPPTAANPANQYPLGSVAMANSSSGTTDPSTNGSQFFIVTGTSGESLPPDYVLFGKVTSGMPVVQKINAAGTSGGTPRIIYRMLKVTVTPS
jgi:cyclophilin family peptidyl-prolyl cis-trans isomerase